MEEFKFFKKGHVKLILNIILTLFGGLLALGGYGFHVNGHTDFAVIFWLLAAVIIGLVIFICLCNIHLYQDRIEISYGIKKTVYFRDVSTLDIVEYNLVFRDSTDKVLAALSLQNIGLELTAVLNFIRKHNPHIQLGSSFIAEKEFYDMVDQAAEKKLIKIIEEMPEDKKE